MTAVLFGELRTGRITDVIDATTASWKQVSNGPGEITVTVTEDVVRKLGLRDAAAAARTFLAVDVGGRLQEAGPIWSRTWDDTAGVLTLKAAGLWSIYDHRYVLDPSQAGVPLSQRNLTIVGATLGGLAKSLVRVDAQWYGATLPIVYGAGGEAGHRTESFPGWRLSTIGEELRQLTQREVFAPDIRFRPEYTADRLSVQWVLETGDEDNPLLTQVGDDWVFDANAPRGPVRAIHTDEDATQMGSWAFVTGEGTEQDMLMAASYDPTLVDAGWPLLAVEEARSSVSDPDTLQGHADNLRDRRSRPIEVWKVVVNADAAAEVQAGHYARVVPNRKSPWLGQQGEAHMRIKSKSGDLGDAITLEAYPTQAML